MVLSFRSILAAALAAFALVLSGCATEGERRTVGQFTDDATLTARVKTAIAKDVGAGAAANVNVNSYRGVVQLSGFVESKEQAQQAAAAARKVDGVKNVENNVQVRPAAS
jgi:hyperosmotically inducible periplasmic protein